MTYEHDLLSRLVNYHDHISAPPVTVADDLQRGRRRVRHKRGLVVGGVALGLASVIAAVTLTTGEPSADRLLPAEPPGLTPLVVPESPLDVRELGFHVQPVPGVTPNQDWSLAPDHQATTVDWAGHQLFVRVYYPGAGPPDWQLNVEPGQVQEVSVNGVAGSYVEQFGKGTAAGAIDFSAGACGTPPRGCGFWQSQLLWEFAPDSWASVWGMTGESPPQQAVIRPAFLKVAEALRSGGGMTTRVPFRVETELGPLPPPTEAGVGLAPVDHPPAASGWLVSFYGEPTLQFAVDGSSCRPGTEDAESTAQSFTYRGHQGCVLFYDGEGSGVVLRVDGVDRVMSNPWGRYRGDDLTEDRLDELKQWLADLTVAPLDDPSAWFTVKSALGGDPSTRQSP